MPRFKLVGLAAAALLPACAWVLPKRPPPLPPPPAEAAAYEACTLELTESRKSLNISIPGGGAAQPLVLAIPDAPPDDRRIRDGARVTLRRGAAADAPAHATDMVPARIDLVGAREETHAVIGDRSLIRLRALADDRAAGHGNGELRGPSLPDEDLMVLKADMPNPARPSSCDSLLRDGDFVFLKSPAQNAWVAIDAGGLAVRSARSGTGFACHTPREECHTDRAGGLVCVNYFGCDGDPGP